MIFGYGCMRMSPYLFTDYTSPWTARHWIALYAAPYSAYRPKNIA